MWIIMDTRIVVKLLVIERMWTVADRRKHADSYGYKNECGQSRIYEMMWTVTYTYKCLLWPCTVSGRLSPSQCWTPPYGKKVQTAMVNNSTNIIKTNNYLPPQIIEDKKKRPRRMALEIQILYACCDTMYPVVMINNLEWDISISFLGKPWYGYSPWPVVCPLSVFISNNTPNNP